MLVSPNQALLGLLATLIPSALGTPVNNIDVNVNSTSTTPSLVDRSQLAVPVPSNLRCYKKMKGCKYLDVDPVHAKEYGRDMCNKQKGKIGKPGWEGVVGWVRNKYHISYNMRVDWKEGCTAPGDGTMKVNNPAPGTDCFDVLLMGFANCKGNGGRGGAVDFGCLTYHYNIINGNEVGRGHCVNVPFDNSSLGGDGYM